MVADAPDPAAPDRLAEESRRDDVVGRLARRLQRMSHEVAQRETALQAEIAALREEIGRARSAVGHGADPR